MLFKKYLTDDYIIPSWELSATYTAGGQTILMKRQNVTAGCLNFAKSHFAIPDSGVW